jgi:hypothetical protein
VPSRTPGPAGDEIVVLPARPRRERAAVGAGLRPGPGRRCGGPGSTRPPAPCRAQYADLIGERTPPRRDHRRQQRDRHPAGPSPPSPGWRTRPARSSTSTGVHATRPPAHRRRRAGRGLLRDERLQVVGPAPGRVRRGRRRRGTRWRPTS